jgi:putative ABC transport system permease protein
MSGRIRKTPLAWSNLVHDPKRLAASLAGIGFAVVLIFTELGFLYALLESTVAPLERLRSAEPSRLLLVVHRDKETLIDSRRFARRWLIQAEARPEIQWACAVYLESNQSDWRNPTTGKSRKIRVLSSGSEELLATLARKDGVAERLWPVGTALFDIRSKPGFGFEKLPRNDVPPADRETWVARQPVRLVGTFDLGTDFVNDGNLLMGLRTFDALFPLRRTFDPDTPTVDIGVIRLARAEDAPLVRSQLQRSLGPAGHLRVLTVDELIAREQAFWESHTPIGPIFSLGVVLGFVVGVVICYQVLSSGIRDHLPEYATLKALGYGNAYLVKLVFRQALWLALLGFVPGLVFAWGVYGTLGNQTGLPMQLTLDTIEWVLVLTLAMCSSSAYLAIRKLFEADPAGLFR